MQLVDLLEEPPQAIVTAHHAAREITESGNRNLRNIKCSFRRGRVSAPQTIQASHGGEKCTTAAQFSGGHLQDTSAGITGVIARSDFFPGGTVLLTLRAGVRRIPSSTRILLNSRFEFDFEPTLRSGPMVFDALMLR